MRDAADQHEATQIRELEALRKALAGRRHLIGDTLTYADIAMAVVLQGVRPVDARYMAGLPGIGDEFYPAELQRRYADLLTWRDELYAQYRRS
jgi:glutathione S-transferase